jgi:chitinase
MVMLRNMIRNLKVLLSVGGWTYSQENHFSFVTNSAYRTTFVNSAISMIENLGLDGMYALHYERSLRGSEFHNV